MKKPFVITILAYIFSCHVLLVNAQEQTTQVSLKTGKVLFPNSITLVDIDKPSAHLLLDEIDQVSLKLIDHYIINSEFHLIKQIEGLGYVDLQKIVSGSIPVYEFSKTIYNPNFGGGISTEVHQYYQIGNELKPVSIQNLKKDLTDESSQKMIKKIKRASLVKAFVFSVGIGLSVYGLSEMSTKPAPDQPSEFKFTPNTPFIAGVIVIASPFLFKKENYSSIDVINNYNFNFELSNKK